MRKIKFTTGEYYHIYNRGVEKRDIFVEDSDYWRFVTSTEELNSPFNITNLNRRIDSEEDEEASSGNDRDLRLVGIVCYCLMPNHFHFIVRQKGEGGVSKFMQKLLTSYTMYFNIKYKRTGALFQGCFKAKHVEDIQYLLHLSRYVHLNPLDLLNDNNPKNKKKAAMTYRWASTRYYLDDKLPCYVKLEKDVVLNQFGNIHQHELFMLDYCDWPPVPLDAIQID